MRTIYNKREQRISQSHRFPVPYMKLFMYIYACTHTVRCSLMIVINTETGSEGKDEEEEINEKKSRAKKKNEQEQEAQKGQRKKRPGATDSQTAASPLLEWEGEWGKREMAASTGLPAPPFPPPTHPHTHTFTPSEAFSANTKSERSIANGSFIST